VSIHGVSATRRLGWVVERLVQVEHACGLCPMSLAWPVSSRVTWCGGCAAQVIRIRRDTYDIDGTAIAKEIVHAATSLDAKRATPEALAGLARGQRAIEAVHWLRHRLPRGPQHRLRRRRPPGHGHPPQHRHQPAPHRRDHRDRPHPPGLRPRPHPNPRRHSAIDADLSDFADPVGQYGAPWGHRFRCGRVPGCLRPLSWVERGSGRSVTTRFITMVEVSRCTPGSVASFSSRSVT